MTELVDLEALIGRLATIDFSQTSEQATREMAVNPVIGALGWDTFNPSEVAREHPVRGGKVDYCLRGPRGPLVLIEVKRTGTELSEHQEQLLGYAFREGVPLAALTDGLIWWLYLPTAEGSWEQRRFYRIDFCEQNAARAAAALHRFLNREGLVEGIALDEARREFESQERDRRVRATLQDAWRQVLCKRSGFPPLSEESRASQSWGSMTRAELDGGRTRQAAAVDGGGEAPDCVADTDCGRDGRAGGASLRGGPESGVHMAA